MKQFYTVIITLLISFTVSSQSYQFGIVSNNNYNFSIIAMPDFDATDTDISDIGFAIMLPAGNADLVNISQFNTRTWTANEVTAAQLNSLSLGDGTRDGFAMNLPPGQTMLSHTSGVPFILVSFDVSNMPMTGQIELLSNSDPIAQGLGGVLDSFYNSNIDATSTQDYFGGLVNGMESFSFDTLDVDNISLANAEIAVYPNPTQDQILVDTVLIINNLELYNVLGKLIIRNKDQNQIDLSKLPSGIYLLKVNASNGMQVIKRIIKN